MVTKHDQTYPTNTDSVVFVERVPHQYTAPQLRYATLRFGGAISMKRHWLCPSSRRCLQPRHPPCHPKLDGQEPFAAS